MTHSRRVGQRQGAETGGAAHTRAVGAAGRDGQPGEHGGRRDIARPSAGRGTGREAQQPGGPDSPHDDRGRAVLQQRARAAHEEQGQTVVPAVVRAAESIILRIFSFFYHYPIIIQTNYAAPPSLSLCPFCHIFCSPFHLLAYDFFTSVSPRNPRNIRRRRRNRVFV